MATEKQNNLIKAVYANNWPETQKLLSEAGVDVNARDERGYAALHYAVSTKSYNFELVKLLIDKQADVDAMNCHKATPLHYAAIGGHKDAVELLVAKGANVALKNESDETLLHLAACSQNASLVELVLDKYSIDVNGRDGKGKTPLYYAWSEGVIKVLAEHGANFRVVDDAGITPLASVGHYTTYSGAKVGNLMELYESQQAVVKEEYAHVEHVSQELEGSVLIVGEYC